MFMLPPVLLSIKSRSGISKYRPMVWAKFRSSIKQRHDTEISPDRFTRSNSRMSAASGYCHMISMLSTSKGRRPISKIRLKDLER